MLRRCGRCFCVKPDEAFAWRRQALGQRDNYCRDCRAAYKKEHYEANKARYVANAARRRQQMLERRLAHLLDFLELHPCSDCGEQDPVVLEFDHLGDKEFAISPALRTRSWESILREIAKCEVVCANCHRRRTATRGSFARAVLARRRLTL